MKELYFTSPRRRTLRTIRLEYGQVGKKFVLRTFEGNIIGRRVSEGSPKEEVFDDEKELLKMVYETKKGLLEGRWIVKINSQSLNHLSSKRKLLTVRFRLNSQLTLILLCYMNKKQKLKKISSKK